METIITTVYHSPFGNMEISASDKGIRHIKFYSENNLCLSGEMDIHRQAHMQLEEYFSGKRKSFDLPLDFKGTNFQVKVWKELYNLPHGKTISYKELAEAVGHPKAYRAVGLANNKNALPIVCACHRVVGSDGSLVGYAYGLDMKKQLLALENISV